MDKPMNSNHLPQTDSIQQLAQCWDTHDVTDFEGELEEVTEAVFDREEAVMVHLTPEDAEAVKEIAKAKGLSDSELIREWIVEKVHSL